MYKHIVLLHCFILKMAISFAGVAQDTSFTELPQVLKTSTGDITGTLTIPRKSERIPIALIIAGSGPTDRDGNNPFMKNDCLKQLAHALAAHNIASLRYDKRGIAQSKGAGKNEADLRFDDYVYDAAQWIKLLKDKKLYTQIIVVGHSEGSLIGMIAGRNADKFVSVAGAGQSADKILKEQLGSQLKVIQDTSSAIIDTLKSGRLAGHVNPILNSLFRPSVQPYLISWFRYDPQEEIKKLQIPILILQGTNDIQVSIEDAKRLKAANPNSKLVMLPHVNHILKKVTGDKQENIKTYNNSQLPIDEELVANIVSFIWAK